MSLFFSRKLLYDVIEVFSSDLSSKHLALDDIMGTFLDLKFILFDVSLFVVLSTLTLLKAEIAHFLIIRNKYEIKFCSFFLSLLNF